MIKFIITESQTLSQAIDNYAPELKPSEILRLFKDKDVKVNGIKRDEKYLLSVGDEVVLYEKNGKTRQIYTTVYEDDKILVADKESGVSSEGLYHYLLRSGDYRFIHRLDRNTMGLILFAKDDETEKALLDAIKQRKIIKTYLALCSGVFKTEKAILRDWLIKDNNQSLVKVVKKPIGGAKEIITEYKVLSKRANVNLVEVVLHTGRTHQIRAHLSSIGCPIVGDGKYGDKIINKKYGQSRQMLIAKRVVINGIDYLDGKTFESERSFDEFLKEI